MLPTVPQSAGRKEASPCPSPCRRQPDRLAPPSARPCPSPSSRDHPRPSAFASPSPSQLSQPRRSPPRSPRLFRRRDTTSSPPSAHEPRPSAAPSRSQPIAPRIAPCLPSIASHPCNFNVPIAMCIWYRVGMALRSRRAVADPHWGWLPHVGPSMGEAP